MSFQEEGKGDWRAGSRIGREGSPWLSERGDQEEEGEVGGYGSSPAKKGWCVLSVMHGVKGGEGGVPGGARVGSREEGRVISIIGDEE